MRARRTPSTGATGLAMAVVAFVASTPLTACAMHVSNLDVRATASASSGSPTPDPTLSPFALSCPESFPVLPWRPATDARQLAPTAPAEAVLCVYQPGFHLSTTLTAGLPVENPVAVAALLNDATPVPDGAVFSCPLDTGGMTIVLFTEGTTTTTVEVARAGCRFATSSRASGGYRPSIEALAVLDALDLSVRPRTGLQD
jgi:hypothetical protein